MHTEAEVVLGGRGRARPQSTLVAGKNP
eukprot:COSAG06_NODE_48746_length_330_cov_0.580087_1_plen_27_part_01